MLKINNEISYKLAMVGDRIVVGHGAVTVRRAYYRDSTKPSLGRFVQEVADALGMPILRDHQILIDSGDAVGSRYIWATFLIEDYRIEMCRAEALRRDPMTNQYDKPRSSKLAAELRNFTIVKGGAQ